MLTLYYKPSCAFSQRVIQMAENLKIELDLRDITESEDALKELLELGGKKATPFFVDTERNVKMYESSDIIDHLREHYTGSAATASPIKPRVHVGGAVCESCEG